MKVFTSIDNFFELYDEQPETYKPWVPIFLGMKSDWANMIANLESKINNGGRDTIFGMSIEQFQLVIIWIILLLLILQHFCGISYNYNRVRNQ